MPFINKRNWKMDFLNLRLQSLNPNSINIFFITNIIFFLCNCKEADKAGGKRF